nr:hypothetical protein [uncultured bacterium]
MRAKSRRRSPPRWMHLDRYSEVPGCLASPPNEARSVSCLLAVLIFLSMAASSVISSEASCLRVRPTMSRGLTVLSTHIRGARRIELLATRVRARVEVAVGSRADTPGGWTFAQPLDPDVRMSMWACRGLVRRWRRWGRYRLTRSEPTGMTNHSFTFIIMIVMIDYIPECGPLSCGCAVHGLAQAAWPHVGPYLVDVGGALVLGALLAHAMPACGHVVPGQPQRVLILVVSQYLVARVVIHSLPLLPWVDFLPGTGESRAAPG